MSQSYSSSPIQPVVLTSSSAAHDEFHHNGVSSSRMSVPSDAIPGNLQATPKVKSMQEAKGYTEELSEPRSPATIRGTIYKTIKNIGTSRSTREGASFGSSMDISTLLRLKSTRIIKLWSPNEEAMLLEFYVYFHNSWSLYRPYFNRTCSSIKMKYHHISRNHMYYGGSNTSTDPKTTGSSSGNAGTSASTHHLDNVYRYIPPETRSEATGRATTPPLLLANKLEAMRYIGRLESIAAGNPSLALQLMRICGTVAELEQFSEGVLGSLQSHEYNHDLIGILRTIPPLKSGGAPAGFGASITHRQSSCTESFREETEYNQCSDVQSVVHASMHTSVHTSMCVSTPIKAACTPPISRHTSIERITSNIFSSPQPSISPLIPITPVVGAFTVLEPFY